MKNYNQKCGRPVFPSKTAMKKHNNCGKPALQGRIDTNNQMIISEKPVALAADKHIKKIMSDQVSLQQLIVSLVLFCNGNWGQAEWAKDINDKNFKERKGLVVGYYPAALDTVIMKSFEQTSRFKKDVVYIMPAQGFFDSSCPFCLEDILPNISWDNSK